MVKLIYTAVPPTFLSGFVWTKWYSSSRKFFERFVYPELGQTNDIKFDRERPNEFMQVAIVFIKRYNV